MIISIYLFYIALSYKWVFPGGAVIKNPPAYPGDAEALWVGKIPLRKKRPPTPVCLSGKPHGQRSLVGYSPRGYKRVRNDLATKQLILKDITLKVCFIKKVLMNWVITMVWSLA